jgi:hypothetical protein
MHSRAFAPIRWAAVRFDRIPSGRYNFRLSKKKNQQEEKRAARTMGR